MTLRSGIATAIVVLLGCAGADGGAEDDTGAAPPAGDSAVATTSTLEGTTWRLQDLGGTAVLPDVEATIQFAADGRVSGKASCNQFGGNATVSGESITFQPLILTRMACQDPINEQERLYVAALEGAERFAIQGDELLIYSTAMDQPLRFSRTS